MSTSAMHVAKTGLTAQQYKMQVIANNLANVNTTGFKRDRANFESLFYQIVKNAGSQTADNTSLTSPLAVGTGVKVVSTQKLFTQGGLVSTDNALDLAIDGKGFFQALLPDGRIGYTRSGILSRNAEGVLTTTSGYILQPQIQIPADASPNLRFVAALGLSPKTSRAQLLYVELWHPFTKISRRTPTLSSLRHPKGLPSTYPQRLSF